MPSRPKQHRLEDLSRVKFQSVLPERWVYRDKDKDYGIDGEVELFDESDKAQGVLFYVQLKATESESETTILNIDFSIETLKYYEQLDVPVLLVRYSKSKDCIYFKWIYKVDLFFAKEGAKTFRIRLDEKDLWTSNSSMEIEKRLFDLKKLKSGYFNFPIPCSVKINEDTILEISKSVLLSQIKRKLKDYSHIINLVEGNKSIVEVTLDRKELKINIADLAGCSFHSIDKRDNEEFAAGIGEDIILGVAAGMLHLGQIDYCARIIFENELESRLLQKKELLLYLLPALFNSSFFERVLKLLGEVLDSDYSDEVAIVGMVNLMISSELKSKVKIKGIEKFLIQRLESAIKNEENTQIGIAHYNLGNHYRAHSNYHKSIKNYISAKRFEPKYLNQGYYYRELAGVLFLIEKYRFAATFYKKAFELGEKEITKALYADSLMFDGQYKNALDAFLDYLESSDKVSEEYHLKSLCLERILETKKIEVQQRDLMTSTSKADISKLKNGVSAEEQLDKSLDIDLLCGLAWFNYGIIHSEKSEYNDAMFSFTMAGLVQNNDIEAWKNAALCWLKTKIEPTIFVLVIKTAFFFNGEEFLEQLFHQVEQSGKKEDSSVFIDLINTITQKEEKEKELPTVRMMNKDGKFENIFKE
ncbi:DUF4365 domain-containing protein [Tenacibaculum maritimum]|uniref:DUF4365 domain-containing protein n=1 Tax=Tenacibaculum maritimum TaxID=107401 RepID=UPI00387741DF